jgi:uncharacterized membrane protein YcaP (DUF421 family)
MLVLRTAVLYLTLIASIRLMGKRQVGQMEPSEFVVALMVADLAVIPVSDPDRPLWWGVVSIGVIVVVELAVSWLSARSVKLRKLLCGKPVILIENGHILQKNLRKTRITADELTGHLRLQQVLDLNQVQFAILETNGSISVFLFPQYQNVTVEAQQLPTQPQSLPVTVIEDGKLLRQNLAVAGKDELWLRRVLNKRKATVRGTFLLTVDDEEHIIWLPMER